ncbi:MAG: TonB-dependent receptor [Bacteroidales bacterium]|nr:TonB-dependent receptor [Bacteroidales bacterium]
MNTRIKSILTLAIILSAIHVIANEESLNDTIALKEVVVTGTKVSVSRNNVPLTISVIKEEEIQQSSESALFPVLSEQVPGLFITERGITGFGVATGSAGQISIRGIGGSPTTQTLILLNGNPQYMGIMGHPLADAYVASDVKQVEVIRGPASTLYGSNAMGGVINIITKEHDKEGYTGNGRIMYGSYNTQKYMANGGFKSKKFNVFIGLNHDRTDGHRDSSDFSITNGYISAGYKINEHLKINADLSLAQFDATDPGPDTVNATAGETIDIFRGMGAFTVDNQFEKFSGSLRLFYNFGEHTITDGFHSNDNNYGLVIYESYNFFKGNTTTLGFDYKNYGGLAENTFAMHGEGITFIDTSIYEAGGYIFIQQQIGQKFTLDGGFRLDYHKVYGQEPIPSIGFAYHALPGTTFKGSIAKGYRSPTIRELFMWDIANDSLQPEEMINYEINWLQYLLKQKLSLEITAFNAHGTNLIKVQNIGGVPKYYNTGSFRHWGLEFAANYTPIENLKLHANYSYIHMSDPVPATPVHSVFISGTYTLKKLNINLSLQSINDLYLLTDKEKIKESYNLLNARVSYNCNKHFGIFIKAENLLNEEYQINYTYPMPKITGFIGINLHL